MRNIYQKFSNIGNGIQYSYDFMAVILRDIAGEFDEKPQKGKSIVIVVNQ